MSDKFQGMTFPQDRAQLRLLSISAFQMWYASQDARAMIFLGQDQEFKRFLFWNYTLRVRVLRMLYKLKRICCGTFQVVAS